MVEPLRLLTAPLRLTGPARLGQLVALVTADEMARRARAAGREVTWECATLAGDLASQHEVERELAREGQDRAGVGRAEFGERVRASEAADRARAGALLAELGVSVDLEAGVLDQPAVATAARTAFVRLYEEGLLSLADQVVHTCPRCLTVVDHADAETGLVEGEALVLRLACSASANPGGEPGPGRPSPAAFTATAGSANTGAPAHSGDSGDPFNSGDSAGRATGAPFLDVVTVAPEFLLGAVAVAVPPGHPSEGQRIELPLAGRTVPIVAAASDDQAVALVVPAHDAAGWELARHHGLAPIEVLDLEGTVRHAGPLDGLGRYAARAATRDLLAAEGILVEARAVTEQVSRCRRCGTVLVPRLGRHWTLPMGRLEVAAADVVREGRLMFSPPSAREEFLARAGQGGEWCVSYQVVAGQPVPAATCLDCGRLSVSVEPLDDCPRCMGELSPDLGVLDARFVGAVWPLAAAGWPVRRPTTHQLLGTTLVGHHGVTGWAVAMAALGLRLGGVVPFAEIVIPTVDASAEDPDPVVPDVDEILLRAGADALREALLAGGLP